MKESQTFHFDAPCHSGDAYIAQVPSAILDEIVLFKCLADKLSFPKYFGFNWDALEECINDLSWISESLVEIIHEDLPLQGSRGAAIYIDILQKAVDRFEGAGDHKLRIYFPESTSAEIRALQS